MPKNPYKPEDKKKTEAITFNVSQSEKNFLDIQAEKLGMSRSQYCRFMAIIKGSKEDE